MLRKIFRIFLPIVIGVIVLGYLIFLVYDRSLIPAGQNWTYFNGKPGVAWEESMKDFLEINPEPNAARHYFNAVNLSKGLSDQPALKRKNLAQLNDSPDADRQVVAKYQEALNEIYQGAEISQCTIPASSYNILDPVPNFLTLQVLSKLVVIDGQLKESDKKYTEALNAYLAGLLFPRMVGPSEQSLISGLIAIAQLSFPGKQLQRLILTNSLSETDYQRIITAVQQAEQTVALQNNLNYEYKYMYNILNYSTSHPGKAYKQEVRKSGGLKYYLVKYIGMFYQFSYRGHILNDCYQSYTPVITHLKTMSYPELMKNHSLEMHPKTLHLRMATPDVETAYIRQQVVNTGLRLVQLRAAVQWYYAKNNRYPSSQEQLVPEYLKELPKDPFSNESFKWNQSGAVPFAYSVGPDMKDDTATSPAEGRILYDPTNGSTSSGDIIPNGS